MTEPTHLWRMWSAIDDDDAMPVHIVSELWPGRFHIRNQYGGNYHAAPDELHALADSDATIENGWNQ